MIIPSFLIRDDVLNNWLARQNPSEFQYKAVSLLNNHSKGKILFIYFKICIGLGEFPAFLCRLVCVHICARHW